MPINLSEDLKLDERNLITLCSMHHSMCDKNKIPYEEVKKIIDEQNKKQSNPPTTLSELCGKSPTPTALINLHRGCLA